MPIKTNKDLNVYRESYQLPLDTSRSAPADLKRSLQIAIGSCECKLRVKRSRDEEFLSPKGCSTLTNRFNLGGAMLTRLWEPWKKLKP